MTQIEKSWSLWFGALCEQHGHASSLDFSLRFDLCELSFWIADDIDTWEHLEAAPEPGMWPGASNFDGAALEQIVQLRKKRLSSCVVVRCSRIVFVFRRTSGTSAVPLPVDNAQQVAVVLNCLQPMHRCLQGVHCFLVGCPVSLVCRSEDTALQSMGPRRALKKLALAQLSAADRSLWLEQARIDAIVGSCRGSLESVKSGVRCYVAFVRSSVAGTSVVFPSWNGYWHGQNCFVASRRL